MSVSVLEAPFVPTEHDEMAQKRKDGIGGSDAGTILGVNPFKSKFTLYMEKIGEIEPVEENERMYIGKLEEAIIADEFSRRTGKKVTRLNKTLIHPLYDFMFGHIDRRVVGEEAGLECKATDTFMKKFWDEDGVPLYHQAQCQHYMMLYKAKYWYLAVKFGNSDIRTYKIDRDDNVIAQIEKSEVAFWQRIIDKEPPEIDGSDDCDNFLKSAYPQAKDESFINLDSNISGMIKDYLNAKDNEKGWKEEKKQIENKLKGYVGDNKFGYCDKYKISWSNVKGKTGFDLKEFQADHPELYQDYVTTGKPTRRFSVTTIKE